MQKINVFRFSLTAVTFFITLLLVLAIGSLFVVPSLEDIRQNIWSPEMRFSLKLSLITGLTSTVLVMIFALPIGYTLSRFNFWGKGFVKTIIDMPIAFPELVLGLCLLRWFLPKKPRRQPVPPRWSGPHRAVAPWSGAPIPRTGLDTLP